ncbi:hypothetical protein [Snodgrassella sp. CS2]|uniref:hypothetical protein n=1 Tax=Snodgrassella sp. CS2 TaxID=3418953 RepID=UPI003D005443
MDALGAAGKAFEQGEEDATELEHFVVVYQLGIGEYELAFEHQFTQGLVYLFAEAVDGLAIFDDAA